MVDDLVSIIIPTHNRSEYVKRAIQSCLDQTYEDIEVIVVDDASTDNTEGVVTSFSDERVTYVRNDENLGAPKTRNRGLDLARGEYINFLDDDDELLPEKVREQVALFQTSDVSRLGVVTCDVLMIRGDEEDLRRNRKQGRIYKDLLTSYCVHGTETMLIKREALADVRFDPSFASNQEYDLSLQLAQSWGFDYVPKLLSRKYASKNQISTDYDKKLDGTKTLWHKYKEEYKDHGVYVYNLARFAYLLFRYNVGKYFGRSAHNVLP